MRPLHTSRDRQASSRDDGMNTTRTSTPAQQPRVQSPAAKAYWASVTRCVAKPDGSGVIYHADGGVERFDKQGWPIRAHRHAGRGDPAESQAALPLRIVVAQARMACGAIGRFSHNAAQVVRRTHG